MDKKYFFGIASAVVLLVGVYLLGGIGSDTKVVEKNNIERKLGGGETGFDCIVYRGSVADTRVTETIGETSYCVETLSMASATNTLAWDNRTGERRFIDDYAWQIAGTEAAADAYVIVLATTTAGTAVGDAISSADIDPQALPLIGGGRSIAFWSIATGTKATSTSLLRLAVDYVPTAGSGWAGQFLMQNSGFPVESGERLVLKMYPLCNMTFVLGETNCVPAQNATSTSRGFNLKVQIKHHD